MFPIICVWGFPKNKKQVCDGHPNQNNFEFSDLKLVFLDQSSGERKTNTRMSEIPQKGLFHLDSRLFLIE